MLFKRLMLSAALATAAVATQAHADALDSIMKSKVIKIAVPQDFAPFGSAGLDLKPQGYDIDMANLIGKELGVKTEIIPVTSANRIPYLQTNKADLVISSLGKNEEREKVIDFSIAYAPFFSGVFGTKAIAVASAADLKGKTIGATRGAIEEQALTASALNSSGPRLPSTTAIRRCAGVLADRWRRTTEVLRLTASWRCQRSSGISSTLRPPRMPALLTRMSTSP